MILTYIIKAYDLSSQCSRKNIFKMVLSLDERLEVICLLISILCTIPERLCTNQVVLIDHLGLFNIQCSRENVYNFFSYLNHARKYVSYNFPECLVRI